MADRTRVEQTVAALKRVQVTRLRTEISWAEWNRRGGAAWFEWLLPRLAQEFELLPCMVNTPAELSPDGQPDSPPDDPRLFSEFVEDVLASHGDCFDAVELWAPDSFDKPRWNRAHDPELKLFARMIALAARAVRCSNKRAVLPLNLPHHDHLWWHAMKEQGVLANIDVVGAQAISNAAFDCIGTLSSLRTALLKHDCQATVWLTAAGCRGGKYDDAKQLAHFETLRGAPVERAYWHALFDDANSGGLLHADGQPKLLYKIWEQHGIEHLAPLAKLNNLIPRTTARPILITGGCGFIGANLAHRLLSLGETVLLFDNLSQHGSVENLRWLQQRHAERLLVHLADVRDTHAIGASVKRASGVIHLAVHAGAQLDELDVNVRGTLNLLEALHALPDPIPLIHVRCNGGTPQLNSTFACARALADQYVEHARRQGANATVLHLGPHQSGGEDRIWRTNRDDARPCGATRAAEVLVAAILDARRQIASPEYGEHTPRKVRQSRIHRLNRAYRAS